MLLTGRFDPPISSQLITVINTVVNRPVVEQRIVYSIYYIGTLILPRRSGEDEVLELLDSGHAMVGENKRHCSIRA